MLLAIDAGNTSISAGCLENGELICKAQFSAERRTADELAVLIGQSLRMRGVDTTAFEGAAMACVVPPFLEVLRAAARLITGHAPLVVGAGVKTGLNIGIDDPSTLGADLDVYKRQPSPITSSSTEPSSRCGLMNREEL